MLFPSSVLTRSFPVNAILPFRRARLGGKYRPPKFEQVTFQAHPRPIASKNNIFFVLEHCQGMRLELVRRYRILATIAGYWSSLISSCR